MDAYRSQELQVNADLLSLEITKNAAKKKQQLWAEVPCKCEENFQTIRADRKVTVSQIITLDSRGELKSITPGLNPDTQ